MYIDFYDDGNKGQDKEERDLGGSLAELAEL